MDNFIRQYLAVISFSLVTVSCSTIDTLNDQKKSASASSLAGKVYLAPIPEQLLPYVDKINENSKEINDLVLLYPMTYKFLESGIIAEKPANITDIWTHDLPPTRYFFDENGRIIIVRNLNTDRGRKDVYFRGKVNRDCIILSERREQGFLIWKNTHEVLTLQ